VDAGRAGTPLNALMLFAFSPLKHRRHASRKDNRALHARIVHAIFASTLAALTAWSAD